ncbi:MAG: asparagine--tRNA ligase [Phycisphaerales bacterium]
MSHATPIAQILKNADQWASRSAVVQGWVRTRRDSKAGVSFVNLSDGSGFDPLQLVVPNTLSNYASQVLHLTAGCAIEARGTIVPSQGKAGTAEMQVEELRVHGMVEDPDTYPIQPKAHTMEFLREQAHLRPRTNTFGALGRVRNTMAMAVHRYFQEHGFFWIHTPIVTGSDCEGAGAMFRVSTLDLANLPRTPDGKVDFSQDFFGKETHLTVSGQLNVECWCLALSKVYTFGPTFRAENSNTSRHLAEFWMIEPELAFADIHADADCAEGLLKAVFTAVLNERADDMKFFAERVDKECITRLEKFVAKSFERITYTEAIKQLEAAVAKGVKFEFAPHWGMDMQSEHERYLTEQVFGRPVVVLNYPKDIKAFYMRLNDDGRTVAAMDILAPGIGEIVGGSQREERLDVLDKRIEEMKLEKSAYWWYRDLRRYGTVPHAGFGLGFERTISYATGLGNVRDCIPFPRTPKNCAF